MHCAPAAASPCRTTSQSADRVEGYGEAWNGVPPQPFRLGDREHKLYEAVSEILQRDDLHALPPQQRHLMLLMLRKLHTS